MTLTALCFFLLNSARPLHLTILRLYEPQSTSSSGFLKRRTKWHQSKHKPSPRSMHFLHIQPASQKNAQPAHQHQHPNPRPNLSYLTAPKSPLQTQTSTCPSSATNSSSPAAPTSPPLSSMPPSPTASTPAPPTGSHPNRSPRRATADANATSYCTHTTFPSRP